MSVVDSERVLWTMGSVCPVLQSVIAIAMLRRKLVRDYPAFFAYTGFEVVSFLVLAAIRLAFGFTSATFFYSYWFAQAVGIALGFAVIHEIYRAVFHTYDALRSLGAILFRWVFAILLLVAVLTAASAPGTDAERLHVAVITLDRSVRVMQCGLLLFLFVFSSYFRLTWQHYVFGFALGFGLFSSVELVALCIRAHVGADAHLMWAFVSTTVYLCAVFVWAVYVLAPRVIPRRLEAPSNNEIEKWNQALLQLLHR